MRACLSAPFGTLIVWANPFGRVQRVRLGVEQEEEEQIPEGLPSQIETEFRAYLDGEWDSPDVPVDDVDASSFQQAVYDVLQEIEAGQTLTYGEVAGRIGKPGAARAVGQALGANPLPLVWPCHRVTAKNGLGGFGGASEASGDDQVAIKRWLLEHEQALTTRPMEAYLHGRA